MAKPKLSDYIQIFVTGGTIDNIDIDTGSRAENTYLPEMTKQARVLPPHTAIKTLMLKDSREITDKDRGLILKKCKDCERNRIILTHGTFTMPETARFLGERVKGKTIILTGSEVPFAKPRSDAMFNLGFAAAGVQFLPPGVYLTMNGRFFDWDNVRKNMKTHVFEKIRGK